MVLAQIVGSQSFFQFRMTIVIRTHCMVLTSIKRDTFKLPNMNEGYNISNCMPQNLSI